MLMDAPLARNLLFASLRNLQILKTFFFRSLRLPATVESHLLNWYCHGRFSEGPQSFQRQLKRIVWRRILGCRGLVRSIGRRLTSFHKKRAMSDIWIQRDISDLIFSMKKLTSQSVILHHGTEIYTILQRILRCELWGRVYLGNCQVHIACMIE